MGTRAQGLFAHATTPGAATIAVTQAIASRYKHICASDPENVCTLLDATPAKLQSVASRGLAALSASGRRVRSAGRLIVKCSHT